MCVDGLRVRGEGKIANASDCLGQTAKDPPILPLMQPVERKRELQVRSHIDNTCMILHANIHLYIYIYICKYLCVSTVYYIINFSLHLHIKHHPHLLHPSTAMKHHLHQLHLHHIYHLHLQVTHHPTTFLSLTASTYLLQNSYNVFVRLLNNTHCATEGLFQVHSVCQIHRLEKVSPCSENWSDGNLT